MKEMDPVGGGGHAPAAPPGSANDYYLKLVQRLILLAKYQQLFPVLIAVSSSRVVPGDIWCDCN